MEMMEPLGMPKNEFAEKAVLGCILLDPDVLLSVFSVIRPEDFYLDSHKKIFAALLSLNEKNEPIDTFLLGTALREQGLLEAVGGVSYLMELFETVPSVANVTSYVKIVKNCAMKRKIIAFSDKLGREAKETDGDAKDLIESAEAEIFHMGQGGVHSTLQHIRPIVADAYDLLGQKEDTLPTFDALDQYLHGLHKTDMVVVAARPGMGKTTFCINLAERAATRHNASVAFFSLEMTNIQLATRMLVSRAQVPAKHLEDSSKLSSSDLKKLADAMDDISKAKIFLDDTPGITVADIRGKARRLKKEEGLDLIVIDYIGLMQASSFSKKDGRQQQMSEISGQLKGLAKELDVPLIAISQLNRASVKSGPGENAANTKVPDLSHLRDSGAIEQDADIVIFIHRPSYYNKELEDQSLAQIIVAKHRSGETGTAEMNFIREYTAFKERDNHHRDEPIPIPPEEQAHYVEAPPMEEPYEEQSLPISDDAPPF